MRVAVRLVGSVVGEAAPALDELGDPVASGAVEVHEGSGPVLVLLEDVLVPDDVVDGLPVLVPLEDGLCPGHVLPGEVELVEDELLEELAEDVDDVELLEEEPVVEDGGRVVLELDVALRVPDGCELVREAAGEPEEVGEAVADAARAARRAGSAGVDSGRRGDPVGTCPGPSSAGWVPSR